MSVLITGATGFLGSRMVLDLLINHRRDVVALGRGTPAQLRARLVRVLRSLTGRELDATVLARLRCVSGDVTKEWLGLPPAMYVSLAQHCEAVWHCAGDIALAGERDRLFEVNVTGTARVMDFAAVAPPSCRLVHVSTMVVAGARRSGVIAEGDLSDSNGFETHYDASKYEAEVLVRRWADLHRRTAVVLRPSIVTTDQQGGPAHPLRMLGQMIEAIANSGAPHIPAPRQNGARLDLRLPVPGDVTFNLVPDGYAVEAMLSIGLDPAQVHTGTRTFHVTHPVETPMGQIVAAIETRYRGLRIECVDRIEDPTPAEQFVAAQLPGFLSYRHCRTYDRSNALSLTPGLADPTPLDRDYLLRALQPDSADTDHVPLPSPALPH